MTIFLIIALEDDSTQQLYLAASTGQTEKFETLFEAEDEKNPCNSEGFTPFLLAARKGHFQICDFALQKVKDLNIDLGKNFLMFRQFQDRLGGTYGKNTQIFFAEIICPSPKVWDFDENRLHLASIVCANRVAEILQEIHSVPLYCIA